MDKNEIKSRLENYLFDETEGAAFVILDGARWSSLRATLDDEDVVYECLHAGDLDPEVLAVSPYIVELSEEGDFFDILFEHVWGHARGIFLRGKGSLGEMRQYLRTLVYAQMPDEEVTLFRFYDPRVLISFMSIATAEQVNAIFGDLIIHIIAEEADGKSGAVFTQLNGEKMIL